MEGVCSMSCFSTTSTQVYDPTESSDDTLGNIEDLWDEPKGRRPDVCKTLLQGDEQSIMQPGKLGLIEGIDNKPKGLEALSPQRAEYTPNPAHWDFDVSRLVKDDPAILARNLSDESFRKFRRIPYEGFVRKAFGLPSKCIDNFLWHYELLAHKIYAKLIKEAVNPLYEVEKVSRPRLSGYFLSPPSLYSEIVNNIQSMEEIKADPFIWAAIENACQSLDQTNVSAEDLTSRLDATLNESLRLVVTPLENVISKPETTQSILQELEVLRLYFHDFYMPLEVDWGSPLDTSNELLEQIRWFDITALADAISRKDHALFSEYIVAAFTEYGQQARWILNTRWDRLRKTVKRLMIAGIGLSSRIDDLAKVS